MRGEKMKKSTKKDKSKAIKKLILLVAFTAIMLIGTTYAWFSIQNNVAITGLQGNVKTAEGLLLSLDAKNWTSSLNLADVASHLDAGMTFATPYAAGANTEPEALTKEDKKSIVKKYLDSLLDRIYDDSLITYEMIKTWGNYEVLNINYERKITDNYYAYSIDIKINNLDAIVPTNKNEALSTEEYIVISLNANITYLESKNGYIVKKIDIPANN
jgi:hypothetical protein